MPCERQEPSQMAPEIAWVTLSFWACFFTPPVTRGMNIRRMIHVVVLFVVIICAQSLNWWLYFSPCISVNSSAIFLIFCLWSPWVESDVSSLASFHFGLFSPDFTNFLLQQNVIVSPLSNCLYIEFKFGACLSNACYFHALLPNWKSTSWRDFLPERINSLISILIQLEMKTFQ